MTTDNTFDIGAAGARRLAAELLSAADILDELA